GAGPLAGRSILHKVGSQLLVSDFNYELPGELIAQQPPAERSGARMLTLNRATGECHDRMFRDFPDMLNDGDLLVLNDSRVIPARLFARREKSHGRTPKEIGKSPTGRIQIFLTEQKSEWEWNALVRPGRKVLTGETLIFEKPGGEEKLRAEVTTHGEFGERTLRFEPVDDFFGAIESIGHIPLPPYIHREDADTDRERYQTVFAHQRGSVAAPTAGLHFTPEILQRVRDRGIEIVEVTLDVGLGTFEPVRTERLEDHKIHAETYEVPQATIAAIERAQRENRPVLAIGTTVVRTLEDAAEKAAQQGSTPRSGRAEATIFLYPGKPLRVVNQLLTNFHLPQSSLLALVATLTGRENILRAYEHAVQAEYRFYSYGDCMLIR
ncbi:MAG: tRNA preQ1(34) S-adenosylmethionine ribosyltransferase-isomerase QueA, partial [Silvibacterium sp.]